ncbi:MAG: zinc-dependent metalloprotease [Flavobacteriaceae bacterium]|nr:zinc-dependent metalloprotease [Flavobacteriaceae bacterium]MDG2385985.1 zinc-dependent metalloprotease [Flavobacteriaceae bacterium]
MKFRIVTLVFLFCGLSFAQDEKKKEKPEKKEKTIEELTKSCKKIEGLFTIYQDTITAEVKMSIKEEQLQQEFIYFSQIADGVYEAGSFRGSYRGSTLFEIKKYFNKIEIIAPNTNFYFDPENPLSKSKDANISEALISSSKILAHDKEKGLYLINANDLFLSETLTRVKQPKRPNSPPNQFSLGSFDKNKSKIEEIKNYPENTNIKTEYVFKNPSVRNGGSEAVTDGRNVSIKVFHTFLNLPTEDYEVRRDDPRVGYFITQVNDQTATTTTNYRDRIHRWKLIKKNPEQAISEPLKPITWWIENSTPMEWREVIKEGVLAWNEAFEKAGFKNAIEVKVQPDDAEWDAGDIRYNVLRWTSSPRPPFGGYGPSMTNPKTGEIIGADIMLEFVHFTNRVFYDKLFVDPTSVMELETLEEMQLKKGIEESPLYCSLGSVMHENLLFGTTFLQMMNAPDFELEKVKKESMKALIMHEVGHTLGLNHNMKASQLFSPEELYDAEFIQGKALTGSVMDYAGLNINPDRDKQGHYADMAVGPYDIWAIQYGYQPFENENDREALLERSTEPELIFGNDADDMRSPGKAIDPRVMTGDLSSDQIQYSIDRIKLVNRLKKDILNQFSVEGEFYDDLRRSFYVLNSQSARAGDILSRFIGGVYVERTAAGQKGAKQPYTPVSLKDQKRAFNALSTYIFSPAAFNTPKEVYNYLAKKRRGFDFFSGPEDPKIHEIVLGYQARVLAHLLHPNTLQRILDSELYGNQYPLDSFMAELNKTMFSSDVKGNINTFRQNLQLTYVKRLIDMIKGSKASRFNMSAQSLALYNLKQIQDWVKKPKGNLSSVAHKTHLNTLIENVLKEVK